MRCLSYCTASKYLLKDLYEYLINNNFVVEDFDDVIFARMKNDEDVAIFFFSFGCVTIWGSDDNREKRILEDLKDFEIEPLDKIESDLINFKYHRWIAVDDQSTTLIDEENNEIILGDKSEYTKLSISYALAQSVKLVALESSTNKILKTTAPIQKELARSARITLPQKELSKQIGHLFGERCSINLLKNILDVPEFFWRKPRYEPLYTMTAKFQDIITRQGILNHRLDIIQELYTVLSEELNHKHISRLDIIIVALIVISIVTTLFRNNII